MFDLKGSKRNRFVRKPGKNSTLLDTNFKVNRNGLPIALKHKHKAYMFAGIINDTIFLK